VKVPVVLEKEYVMVHVLEKVQVKGVKVLSDDVNVPSKALGS
jgi:hypothetical protein